MYELELYTRPDCYIGATYYDYYVFLSKNRGSSILETCNYDLALQELNAFKNVFVNEGEDNEAPAIIDSRAKHWVCGWIDTIYIHKDAKEALSVAQKICDKLNSYPVLNEDVYSDMQYNELDNYFNGLSVGEKIETLLDVVSDNEVIDALKETLAAYEDDTIVDYNKCEDFINSVYWQYTSELIDSSGFY